MKKDLFHHSPFLQLPSNPEHDPARAFPSLFLLLLSRPLHCPFPPCTLATHLLTENLANKLLIVDVPIPARKQKAHSSHQLKNPTQPSLHSKLLLTAQPAHP